MKKLLLIPALLGTLALVADYNYEITPLIGYNIAEGNLNLKDSTLIGLEAQFNNVDSVIKPELSILHSSKVKSEQTIPTLTSNITRLGLNGVYEISKTQAYSSFAKAGIGYEIMDTIGDNKDAAFIDAGAGVKVPFTKDLALKLEALYMLKHNDGLGGSNLALLSGINYSFGEEAKEVVPTPVAALIDGDDDKDGVLNSIDRCPTTFTRRPVNAQGCFVDGDDEKMVF